jgi:hypothetical protein
VDSYRQLVLASIIVVIDLWFFGHLFAPPAAKSAFYLGWRRAFEPELNEAAGCL